MAAVLAIIALTIDPLRTMIEPMLTMYIPIANLARACALPWNHPSDK
jgi:hypothetical protein